MLRIVHYIPAVRLEQGGVVRVVLDLCMLFSRRGHNVTLIVYQDKNVPLAWLNRLPGKPHAIVLPAPRAPFKLLSAAAMRTVRGILQNADVVHLHGPWLDGNRQIAQLARKLKVPYIVSLHGMLDNWPIAQRPIKKRVYMALFGRRVLNQAATIHCTAAGELKQVQKWFDHSRTSVLPCLIDWTSFQQLPGPELGQQLLPETVRLQTKLLFLSRLHEQKGVDLLIQTADLLRSRELPFILVIAGSGEDAYEQYLQKRVTELSLQDRVIFLGLITGPAKISLLQCADLFVLPTRHENFGLAITEAMACGTAVLTTRGTDIWAEVQSAGAVISENSPEALADNVAGLLGDPIDRAERGKRGREWVLSHLATEPLLEKYEALYRSVISFH